MSGRFHAQLITPRFCSSGLAIFDASLLSNTPGNLPFESGPRRSPLFQRIGCGLGDSKSGRFRENSPGCVKSVCVCLSVCASPIVLKRSVADVSSSVTVPTPVAQGTGNRRPVNAKRRSSRARRLWQERRGRFGRELGHLDGPSLWTLA